jgi:hypothetical protein
MPRKSCCTNLLEFFEAATKSVDGGNPFDVIFLDFAKAFDKVPRERLLEKIQAHGLRGNILAWIQEWLTGRQQSVVLNGPSSDWEEVLSGVPQGSVLGPPVFTIYIDAIDDIVRFIKILRNLQMIRSSETLSPLQMTEGGSSWPSPSSVNGREPGAWSLT